MNKKRHFLEPPEVKGYLVKGDRFTKWSEVSCYTSNSGSISWSFIWSDILKIVCEQLSQCDKVNMGLKCVWKLILSLKDSTKTFPVTMKMDPKGFYVYWINQSKVINIQSGRGATCPVDVGMSGERGFFLNSASQMKLDIEDSVMFGWLTSRVCVMCMWSESKLRGSWELHCTFRSQQLEAIIDLCWCGLATPLHSAAELQYTAPIPLSAFVGLTSEAAIDCVPHARLKCSCEVSFNTSPYELSRQWSTLCNQTTQILNLSFSLPKDDLYLNPYLDRRLHVKFSVGDYFSASCF